MFMPKDMQEKLQNKSKILALALLVTLIVVGNQAFTQAPDENYMSGCAGLVRGDYRQAVEDFSYAITRNNADEQLFIKRGEAHLKLKEFDRAGEDFSEANVIYPGVADIWLARCYALAGDKGKAITFLTGHLKSEFRLPEDSIKQDHAFDELQASPEWHAIWQNEWYSDEEKVEAELGYYSKKKRFDEAGSLLAGELSKNPNSKVLYSIKGKLAYDQGNYAAAIADYTSALNLDKNLASVYPARGKAYLKAGKFRDAVNDFNRALKTDPADFGTYLQRAEAYAGNRIWDPAIRDLQIYLKYFNNDQKVLHQCGEYYYESEDYINALKYFNLNLRDDPNNSLYYKSRGKTYLKTSTYRYALSDLSMSLDLNPEDAETWMYMGLAKIRSGDKEKGCSDLQRAQRMGNVEAVKYIVDYCK
jgi:tetratricopeptide (TPR) repeat protein